MLWGTQAPTVTYRSVYQHSGSTDSHRFQEVLKACPHLHIKYVNLPSLPHRLGARNLQDHKYTPYFDDCLGALDGTSTHI